MRKKQQPYIMLTFKYTHYIPTGKQISFNDWIRKMAVKLPYKGLPEDLMKALEAYVGGNWWIESKEYDEEPPPGIFLVLRATDVNQTGDKFQVQVSYNLTVEGTTRDDSWEKKWSDNPADYVADIETYDSTEGHNQLEFWVNCYGRKPFMGEDELQQKIWMKLFGPATKDDFTAGMKDIGIGMKDRSVLYNAKAPSEIATIIGKAILRFGQPGGENDDRGPRRGPEEPSPQPFDPSPVNVDVTQESLV